MVELHRGHLNTEIRGGLTTYGAVFLRGYETQPSDKLTILANQTLRERDVILLITGSDEHLVLWTENWGASTTISLSYSKVANHKRWKHCHKWVMYLHGSTQSLELAGLWEINPALGQAQNQTWHPILAATDTKHMFIWKVISFDT